MSEIDKLLIGISEKLDKVLRLLAVDVVKGINTEQGKVELLDSLGFRPIEIARLLNKTEDNVNVQLNIVRKKHEIKKPQQSDKINASKSTKDNAPEFTKEG